MTGSCSLTGGGLTIIVMIINDVDDVDGKRNEVELYRKRNGDTMRKGLKKN